MNINMYVSKLKSTKNHHHQEGIKKRVPVVSSRDDYSYTCSMCTTHVVCRGAEWLHEHLRRYGDVM